MKIHNLRLGKLDVNCYILEKFNYVLIIDMPADNNSDLEKVKAIIGDKTVVGIIYTHNHFDHISGGQFFSNIKQYMHLLDIKTIKEQIVLGKYFSYSDLKIPEKLDDTFNFNSEIFSFKIIHTPGHSMGSICILFEKEKIIFTGDTIFKNAIGRTDIPYADYQTLQDSLKKILSLDKQITLYPGHGRKTTIGDEAI